jgi:hypothetical protein
MPDAKDERSTISIPITSARAAMCAESPTAATPSNICLFKILTAADGFFIREYYQSPRPLSLVLLNRLKCDGFHRDGAMLLEVLH